MRQSIDKTRRHLLFLETSTQNKMVSNFCEFSLDEQSREKLTPKCVVEREANISKEVSLKARICPDLADLKRFSFQNVHEIAKKPLIERAYSEDPQKPTLERINTITYAQPDSPMSINSHQRDHELTSKMEDAVNILQSLAINFSNPLNKTAISSPQSKDEFAKPHSKLLRRVKIESKKNRKNIVEITRRLTDIADMLDAKSNTDSTTSVTSKRKKRKVKKARRLNSGYDIVTEENLHKHEYSKKPTCKSDEETFIISKKKRYSLQSNRKGTNESSGLKLSLNKCPLFTEINQNMCCNSNYSNNKEIFDQPPQKLEEEMSYLRAYSLKKSSNLSSLEDSELLSCAVQKSCKSLKRKSFKKKRKDKKLLSSRVKEGSGSDSFKFSLFRADQMKEMLNSLSNLESNQSNYSSTTLSPSPAKRIKD
ncbi:unnamed protein product [Moneuplotes crassus]|uniref:Uncharacterized protein n=1 Tax=Euplotes crassus TaxID=5936 RepID=A0AAD1U6J3_EUPCR|nr:unnamed protein product [Moneuplotes crassus]